jgi:hypothetical protein
LGKFPGPIYTGRQRGEGIRAALGLDDVDSSDVAVDVIIPADAYAISSSFFLGLFGPSVKRAGTLEAFFQKFRFQQIKPSMLTQVQAYVARALQSPNLPL